MIFVILLVLGLCLGSFVNALVWRLHEQEAGHSTKRRSQSRKSKNSKAAKLSPKPSILSAKDLSILNGRSMCPDCHHQLAAKDLVPLFSWLQLRGKCRYCHKRIAVQYPLVELGTAGLFIASYAWWPMMFDTSGKLNFAVWLVMLTGFMALLLYDLRWLILPNRIIYPLIILAGAMAVINTTVFGTGLAYFKDVALSVAIAGGLFYMLFQVSKGKWIGGGDVKLGFLIGILVASPVQAFLVLFTASLIGTVTILPGLFAKKLTATSKIPFGPYLIVATIIVKLFGASIVTWYRQRFMLI